MTATPSFVDHVCHQAAGAGAITARAMFGGHRLYCDSRLVALIGDGELFVKLTTGGRALARDVAEASPYPGSKPCLLIDEQIDNAVWLAELIAPTARELPIPTPKKLKM